MQKEATLTEFTDIVNKIDDIKEPIVLKRNNKKDLIVISMEEYKKYLFLSELNEKIEKSEKEIEEGKIYKAKEVFKELREKYGY